MHSAMWKALVVLFVTSACCYAEPAARLVIDHPNLTINRPGGRISLIARAEAVGSFTGARKFRIAIPDVINLSGISLESGAEGKLYKFSLKAGTSEECVLDIATTPNNHQSGRLIYWVHLTDDDHVEMEGSPQKVVVTTVPN